MTRDEKLQHFYNVTIDDANRQRKKILKDYQKSLETEYRLHVENRNLQVKNDIEVRSALVRRNINREFSSESLEIKHAMSDEQGRIIESLFKEAEKKLQVFKKTPEYVDYLCGLIDKVKAFAGKDEVKIFIDPSDNIPEKIKILEERAGQRIYFSSEPVWGGLVARIESKNILIDETFKTALEEAKENYSFEGDIE